MRQLVNHTHTAPAPGSTLRVGGDMAAQTTGRNGDFRSGACRVDTPLPAGYPPPTPPGALEVKTYPSVRLAQVAGSGDPDRGMNRAFWPLFNHIKKHGIAMTSPVEVAYQDVGAADSEPGNWSMAFLYRTPDLNDTGTDGPVTVLDAQPTTVVAFGWKGDYSMEFVSRGMRIIEDWLAANPQWVAAGNWRSLYYNGPTLIFWNKWAEVQLPVAPAAEQSRSPNPPIDQR